MRDHAYPLMFEDEDVIERRPVVVPPADSLERTAGGEESHPSHSRLVHQSLVRAGNWYEGIEALLPPVPLFGMCEHLGLPAPPDAETLERLRAAPLSLEEKCESLLMEPFEQHAEAKFCVLTHYNTNKSQLVNLLKVIQKSLPTMTLEDGVGILCEMPHNVQHVFLSEWGAPELIQDLLPANPELDFLSLPALPKT